MPFHQTFEYLDPSTPHLPLRAMANALRFLSLDAVNGAKSGHVGLPLGMADVLATLWAGALKFHPQDPQWPDRDRFILSAGHGSAALYSLLHLTGYGLSLKDLHQFRQWGSSTPGHPEFGLTPGVEATTGPLGQGLAYGVGMAIGEKKLRAHLGQDLVSHFTYVVAGDGCLMEGISQEACSLAGHLGLENLIVLWDDNQVTIDGPVSLSSSENIYDRFRAMGWDVQSLDGHNYQAILEGILHAKAQGKPSLIGCRTTIGRGLPQEGTAKSHGGPFSLEDRQAMAANFQWHEPPFSIPQAIQDNWQKAAQRHAKTWQSWQDRFQGSPKDVQARLNHYGEVTPLLQAIETFKKTVDLTAPCSTRKMSGKVLDCLTGCSAYLMGGSADLSDSNQTKSANSTPFHKENPTGNYLHYGVREQAMGGIMNGLCLHGGIIPYGGTFLSFSDYMRPSFRLSSLMELPVIYVMTHDSIGLGQDGPTHHPIEHLFSLRMIPGVTVWRPWGWHEVIQGWEYSLQNFAKDTPKRGPVILCLTRQNIGPFPEDLKLDPSSHSAFLGAYVLQEKGTGKDRIDLWASGSEVDLALGAGERLWEDYSIPFRVISCPSLNIFQRQPLAYQNRLLPKEGKKVAIEAGSPWGWERFLGKEALLFGLESFSQSAPQDVLYEKSGLTVANIVKKILEDRKIKK